MFVGTQLEDWIKIYQRSVFLLLQATFHYKDLKVTTLYPLPRDEVMSLFATPGWLSPFTPIYNVLKYEFLIKFWMCWWKTKLRYSPQFQKTFSIELRKILHQIISSPNYMPWNFHFERVRSYVPCQPIFIPDVIRCTSGVRRKIHAAWTDL